MGTLMKNGISYSGSGLPEYTSADAEKVLKVNSGGSGLEWAEDGGGTTGEYLDKVNPNGSGSFNFNSSVGMPNTCNIFFNMNDKSGSSTSIYPPLSARSCQYNLFMNPSTVQARDLHMNLLIGNACRIEDGGDDFLGCEILGQSNFVKSETGYNRSFYGLHLEGNNSRIRMVGTSQATNYGNHVEGDNVELQIGDSHCDGLHAEGEDIKAIYNYSEGGHVEGCDSTVNVSGYDYGSHFEGYTNRSNIITACGAHYEGYYTTAAFNYNYGGHIEGYRNLINGTRTLYGTHIEGYNTTATGSGDLYGCHYQGMNNNFVNTSGNYSSDQGGYENNLVVGYSYGDFIRGYSINLGVNDGLYGNSITGEYMNIQASSLYGCSIEGVGKGKYSEPVVNGGKHHGLHIEGFANTFSRTSTADATTAVHIEGRNNAFYSTDKNNYGVHIEGYNSQVANAGIFGTHVEGSGHNLTGGYIHDSHIEGSGSVIVASGDGDYNISYNHVEGYGNQIIAPSAHRSGSTNWCNHIEGYCSTALGKLDYSHIGGSYHYITDGDKGYNEYLDVSGTQSTVIGVSNVIVRGRQNFVNNSELYSQSYIAGIIAGESSTATNIQNCILLGDYSTISGTNNYVLGHQNRMPSSSCSHNAIVGGRSTATGTYNYIFGDYNQANGTGTIAIGSGNISSPTSSVAIGYNLAPSSENQVVIGSINVDGYSYNNSDGVKGSPSTSRQFAVMIGSTVSTTTTAGEPTTVRQPIEALSIDKETGETWFYHNGNQYKMGDIIDALINAGMLS